MPTTQNAQAQDGLPYHQDVGEKAQDNVLRFLREWIDMEHETAPSQEDASPGPYYARVLKEMREKDQPTMSINYDHISQWSIDVAETIKENFLIVEPYLRKAVRQFVSEQDPEFLKDNNREREFYISIVGLPVSERLRDLRTEKVGKLVAFKGTVTRTSEVRPELYQGAFRCLECSTVVTGVEQQFKYTTPSICKNATCGNRKAWKLVREQSVFVDWQRVKVQENADEVPGGSLPRTMDVILRHRTVEKAKAGDRVLVTGSLVAVPDVAVIHSDRLTIKPNTKGNNPGTGGVGDGVAMKSLGARELTYKLMFLGTDVQAANATTMVNIRSDEETSSDETFASFDEAHQEEIRAMVQDPDIYNRLAKSLAPAVYGHEEVKKSLLLMLLGGVHKSTKEGINLRGDINVAIIGDPASAKSQLLKYVAAFLPRAVYTSGKASTAAGLTATVVKEAENGEFAIEAGALMLADNGICCIDEFDKMDAKDQVAIHEAMEQQTISIAKAGIHATLNARASILAAANPISGRYDKAKPLKYNIALPPAILSRFDLLHVMVDDTTEVQDEAIAGHILAVHRFREAAFTSENAPYSREQMQRYIKYARSIKPKFTDAARQRLVRSYIELRGEDAAPGSKSSYRITVRQLEALVRLSEAAARARCSDHIQEEHVREAKRLLRSSILKIEQNDIEFEEEELEEAVPAPGDEAMPDAAPAEQAAAGGGEPAAAAEGAQPARRKVQIDVKKYNAVKVMLMRRLVAQDENYRRLEAGHEDGTVSDEQFANTQRGLAQGSLVNWYIEQMIERGAAFTTEEEVEAEMELVHKIIAHMLRHDPNHMTVTWQPAQAPGSSDREHQARLREERLLVVHANYDAEA